MQLVIGCTPPAVPWKERQKKKKVFVFDGKERFVQKEKTQMMMSFRERETGNTSKQRETAKRFKSEREAEQRPP